MNIKLLSQRYKIYNYNIGLTRATPTDVIDGNLDLCKVHWLKHNYYDRMFADPFILKETNTTLEILVEESLFLGGAASLVKLTICTRTFKLLNRKTILSIGNHLSYPYIFFHDNAIYVLPENIASNKLMLYRYDEAKEKCVYVKTLLDIPVSDPNIIYINGKYWLFGGKKGTDQEELYLWCSDCIFGDYYPQEGVCVKENIRGSRMAGDFFRIGEQLYRPSQDCLEHYGAGTIVWKVDTISLANYKETEAATLYPQLNSTYPDGIHTLNFSANWCVIDGLHIKPDFWRGALLRLNAKFRLNLFD